MPKRWIGSCYAVVFYLRNFTHLGHFNVTWVHTSAISFVACRKVSLFHLFTCNKENSRYLHAGLEDVTNKNSLPNLLLNVNWWSHSAVYNWHHWYQCCEIWDLSTLADKFGIVFETSKLKLAWWQFCFWKLDTHWKTIYYYSPSHLSTEWKESVADPDLQIRGGGRSSRPWPSDNGGNPVSQKNFFGLSGLSLVET